METDYFLGKWNNNFMEWLGFRTISVAYEQLHKELCLDKYPVDVLLCFVLGSAVSCGFNLV